MPEICRFDGIRIIVWWSDHNPPHFHARYGEFDVKVDIRTASVLQGRLPTRLTRKLLTWAHEHQSELMEAWDDVRAGRTPKRIAPPTN